MAYVTIPYSFTTGTASDAGKVNANFTALSNGLSDGSKDLYVSQVKATSATIAYLSCTTFAGSYLEATSALVAYISATSILATNIQVSAFKTSDATITVISCTSIVASGSAGQTSTFVVSGISLTFTSGILTDKS